MKKSKRSFNQTEREREMESAELQRLLDVYYGNSSDARLKKVVQTKLNEWKRRPDGRFFLNFDDRRRRRNFT